MAKPFVTPARHAFLRTGPARTPGGLPGPRDSWRDRDTKRMIASSGTIRCKVIDIIPVKSADMPVKATKTSRLE